MESLITITLANAATYHGDEGERTDNVVGVVPGYSELRPGAEVNLVPDLTDAVLFSAATGEALGRKL